MGWQPGGGDSKGTTPDGTETNLPIAGYIFQTFALLGDGVTFDSGVLPLEPYTQVSTHILSDKLGTMVIDFIRDAGGTDILRTLTIPYATINKFETFSAPAFTPFVRYRWTCDEAGQGDFYFDTKVLAVPLSAQVLGVDAFISPLMSTSLVRAIIAGQSATGNTFENATMQETSNDDGTYQNLMVVSGARPSQLAGRSPIKIVLNSVTTDSLQYTVTANKTLFITDLVLTVLNDSNGDGNLLFEDALSSSGGNPKVLPLRTPEKPQGGTGYTQITHTFTEPLEFDVGVWLNEDSGTLTVSGILNGYEE